MKKSLSLILLFGVTLSINAQVKKGVWRSPSDNAKYHHFVREGNGAAVYINQSSESNTILRLSSGTISANQGIKFTVEGNGNVGIGTTSPDSKLTVNGTIHSQKVKVDMVGWSDFVFENTYSLPTLEEVEKHIQKNGHLQDIPNAQEVEENGIYLGEMNAKLLQKIEELTLYAIEQEKKLKKQEKKNNNLEERLKIIEELVIEE